MLFGTTPDCKGHELRLLCLLIKPMSLIGGANRALFESENWVIEENIID